MAGLTYARLIVIAIAVGGLMMLGSIYIMNSVAATAYANLGIVTLSVTMATVGALLFFPSLYSVIKGIIQIEEAEHEKHEIHHENHEHQKDE